MAVRPGEENVATLFGDVHYLYGPPTDKPPHHRFDKGSYVYLFENANEGRARIEVANQPGTDDQDAFDGFLDQTQVHYSYKHHCMVSITVGDAVDQEQWHLPTYDPRNENKYHYRLHSLDIYFWTQKDALQFVNGVRRVLPAHQVEVLDEPGPPLRHSGDVSSVVQTLEKAAISEPAGAPAVAAPPNGPKLPNGIPSFEPPPASAVSGSSTSPQSFAPIAYNPSAPPAPEEVRPREKTPPPEDYGMNPLHQTLAYDATTPFSPGLLPGAGPMSSGMPPPQYNPPPGMPSFPGPPTHSVTSPGMPPQGFGSLAQISQPPAPHPGLARAATVPVQAMHSPGLSSPYGTGGFPQSPAPPYQAVQPVQHTPARGMAPPPPGGYSQFSYSNQGAQPPEPVDYSIHQQLYRPTEGEAAVKYQPKKEVRGRLEENAGRLERGVNGILKKLEKRLA